MIAPLVPVIGISTLPGQAQTQTEIGDVIISGGRVPVDAQSYARANTVITAEDLERRQVTSVADALRLAPGLQVSDAGGQASLRIRGSEANHVLVLIDGVETADSASGFDFSFLTADNIERIEVLRGPQSALYGAGATAGVVNIITKRGLRKDVSASVMVEGGTAPAKAGSVLLLGGTETADGALSISWRDDEGWDLSGDDGEKDGRENLTLNFRGSADLGERVHLRGNARYTDRKSEFDSTQFGCGDSDCYVIDGSGVTEGSDLTLGLAADIDTLGGALVHTPSLGYARSENDLTTDFGPADNETSTLKAGYQASYSFGAYDEHSVTGALEFKRESFQNSYAGGDTKEREALGYVLEYQGEPMDALFVQAGLRFDQNADFKDALSWSASASYAVPFHPTRLHASIGQAQTNPTFFEQFGFIPGEFTGNPDLAPEKNFGFDIGIEQRFWADRALIDVTYFNERLRDEITGFGTTVINEDGTSKRQGVEVSLRVRPIDPLTLGFSYTWLDATDPDGTREVRRPRHAASADIAYRFFDERAQIGAVATYFGDNLQSDFGDASFTSPKVQHDGYFVIDLNASFKVSDGVELFGRVENLLDEDYEEVRGYTSQPRQGFVGLRAKF
ncbi:MAG: TonB-dependent receptor [Neomegalonema sp.]|nr:TonB-dependent receptor [Neomegalonema sp.]